MRVWKINDSEDKAGQPKGWGWRQVRWFVFGGKGRTWAKGWWHVAPWRTLRWWWGVGVALGGEDNMLQLELRIPLLIRGAIGVRVPQSWTRWVYERRKWGIESSWRGFDVFFAHDDRMADMRSYYLEKAERSVIDGRAWPSDSMLWSGWRVGVRFPLPLDMLFGKRRREEEPFRFSGSRSYENGEIPAAVWLPEGKYPGVVTFHRERWVRSRGPFRGRWRYFGTFKTNDDLWMPVPGKGENSWDCGDDGFQGHTTEVSGSEPVAQVLGATVQKVLRYRERYGGLRWEPEGVGVMRG
jgi:hypothetical protein